MMSEAQTMTAPAKAANPSRHKVWEMFDRIAHRYDLLNHLLSFNRDKVWRKKMVACLPERGDLDLLDLATGTGDQLLTLAGSGKLRCGVGLDMAMGMLQAGQPKLERMANAEVLSLLRGDAENIPFADRSFDVVTISFGIRNVSDVSLGLREMRRILKPGGRALILEFSLPKNRLVRNGYLFYFRTILPRLGGMISGDSYAYRYLNQTVETFPYGEAFCDLMRTAGFTQVKALPLTFGVATIYQGEA